MEGRVEEEQGRARERKAGRERGENMENGNLRGERGGQGGERGTGKGETRL